MALSIGSAAADSGLSKAIYDQLDAVLAPPLQAAVDAASDAAKPAAAGVLASARDGWRHLAFAVATGVVNHLVANLEVTGVTVSGTVSVPVTGQTNGPNVPPAHTHGVALSPTASAGLTQNNGGTGLIR